MKRFLRQIFAAAALTAAVIHAQERPEQKLADAALEAGDYTNAISGYHNAMLQADQQNDPEAWAVGALKLCRTYLRTGDLSNARTVLAEFRRRNPLRSAGTLPGDVLVAEGKYAEAEKAFAALVSGDPEALPAVNFSRGMMKLRAGDTAGALQIFTELGKGDSPWAQEAQLEAVYISVRSGKIAAAEEMLQAVPAVKRGENWFTAYYLVEAHAGKTAELKKNFRKFIESQPAHPHIRLFELLSTAAETAVKNADAGFAAVCLNAALDFSPQSKVKQELCRRLINLYAAHFPEKAIDRARLYVKDFPEAADRGQILNSVGRKLMSRQDMSSAAAELFTDVALDPDFPPGDRLEAAADAITAAGKSAKPVDPAPLYRFLCQNSPDAFQRGLWHCRFAEYLEQKKNISGALKEYQSALQAVPVDGREKIRLEMMNFFRRTGDEKNMIKEAELLSKSADLQIRAAAKFQLGKVAEQQSDFTAARRFYLDSARVKASRNQKNAQFLAALMAYRDNDDDEAAAEFVAFAEAHEKSELAPHALYLALEILHGSGNTGLSEKAAALFKEKYFRSDAWAYYVLNRATETGSNGNTAGAIRELESLEKDFAGTAAGLEIALQKAVFLDKNGESEQALTIFSGLTSNDKSAVVAAEGALHAGEILFRRNEFRQARAMFLVAAELAPDGLLADTAGIKSVDCDLVHSASAAPEALAESTARCERLAANTKYPQIRLQALYKLGLCHEWAGNYAAAVSAFEKLLYAARETAETGMSPDPRWCVRGTETALELLVRHRLPGALQRGMRMIRQLDHLGLKPDGMQKKFRDQLEKTRRK